MQTPESILAGDPPFDLSPYVGRGFTEQIDRAIATVGVAGIDRKQTHGMIRLCPETEAYLYGDYSPNVIRYHRGSRPVLEALAAPFRDSPREQQVHSLMAWTRNHVRHPHLVGEVRPDRGASEEELIASGIGWCNEQSRVFIALCETLEIPARLCFITCPQPLCGHSATEVFLAGRWAFVDATFDVIIHLPDGRLAEGRDLQGGHRAAADAAYAPRLLKYYEACLPFVENHPGWRSADRPPVQHGGNLFACIGICNYLIEGVEKR